MQFEDKNLIHPPIAHRGSISMNQLKLSKAKKRGEREGDAKKRKLAK